VLPPVAPVLQAQAPQPALYRQELPAQPVAAQARPRAAVSAQQSVLELALAEAAVAAFAPVPLSSPVETLELQRMISAHPWPGKEPPFRQSDNQATRSRLLPQR
jgi:hypothetical protein